MAKDPKANERRYFDTLKRITLYQSVNKLRNASEDEWGLMFGEALEFSYENIKAEAERAIRGKRRPKEKAQAQEAAR